MTIINPKGGMVRKDELEERYWLNQTLLPITTDDIYNIPCRGNMFKIKKTGQYPFGSIKGFVDEENIREKFFYPYISKDSIFIDAGAALGTYTLRALSIGAKVIAFEPDPRNIDGLNTNVDLNPGFRERFNLYEVALAHTNSHIYMDDLEDVPMFTLDSFDLTPSFIKIDVEGMELQVIDGALNTIKKYHPKILIECHTNWFPDIDLSIKNKLDGYIYESYNHNYARFCLFTTY